MPATKLHRIATERVKWSAKYQKKYGIETAGEATCPRTWRRSIQHLCKRVYRALELSGYARIDLRLDAEGKRLRARGQPEPADRLRRGLRRVGRTRRRLLRAAAAADHPDGAAVAA